jgi:hypothetical protein
MAKSNMSEQDSVTSEELIEFPTPSESMAFAESRNEEESFNAEPAGYHDQEDMSSIDGINGAAFKMET